MHVYAQRPDMVRSQNKSMKRQHKLNSLQQASICWAFLDLFCINIAKKVIFHKI